MPKTKYAEEFRAADEAGDAARRHELEQRLAEQETMSAERAIGTLVEALVENQLITAAQYQRIVDELTGRERGYGSSCD